MNLQKEDFDFKTEDWKCIRAHQEEEKKKARLSIAARIHKASKDKEFDLIKHSEMLASMHEDLKSKKTDWEALKNAKDLEKEQRRKSVCYRLDSWRKEKIAKENQLLQEKTFIEQETLYKEMNFQDLQNAKLLAAQEEAKKLMLGRFMI